MQDDPDRAEVLGDLERSVGDKLVALLGSDDRLVTTADIDGVLEEIGAVDTGHDPVADEGRVRTRARRLHRIREGKKIAGVCTGLAAYAELDVAWVRTLFVFATLLTAGIFALVYIALAFILPVSATRDTYDIERPRWRNGWDPWEAAPRRSRSLPALFGALATGAAMGACFEPCDATGSVDLGRDGIRPGP